MNLLVKDVSVWENKDAEKHSMLPFFADGYPGIVYCQSENKTFIFPQKKELSPLYLYGQMIEAFELSIKGAYQMIVFQLYPFAPTLLFDIDPKKLNDDCCNLLEVEGLKTKELLFQLTTTQNKTSCIELITRFLSTLVRKKRLEDCREIQSAIQITVDRKGLISVGEMALQLNMSERTLQRRFKKYIGISPKKFAKIIQFQSSLTQISKDSFSKLTDVVYENGYADQSHFIRDIKEFTGKKPSQLKSEK